jgi:hypothetical protein
MIFAAILTGTRSKRKKETTYMKLAPRLSSKIGPKIGLALILAASPCAYAQESGNVVYQAQDPGPVTISGGVVMKGFMTPVKGAPYSATITNESVQTLADGNRIVQTSTGTTARDSLGRTRQETALPAIGNLSAAEAPRLVFIQDPVTETSYTLNLTDKTAQKIPVPPPLPASAASSAGSEAGVTVAVRGGPGPELDVAGPVHVTTAGVAGPVTEGPAPLQTMTFHKFLAESQGQVTTEDLGTQTMEGVIVNGVRTTRTIPAGQIGNDKPIVITTEVWTSPDLKTIISSKRNDPRMGEQTFKLTNLVRAEPDASMFAVPSDFKIVDSPKQVIYHANR